MNRIDGRPYNYLRKVRITPDYLSHPAGSVLVEMGGTKVVCSVTFEQGVPGWMRAQGVPGGWVTSEYGMLPASTHSRNQREASRGKQGGRTMEIQRLIGRSLRAVVDRKLLGEYTIQLDCDVLQADGGTRCASIAGAWVALRDAVNVMLQKGMITNDPIRTQVSAISVGVVDGRPVLDLNYVEDSGCGTDMNVVMTGEGGFVEIQGTAEGAPFSEAELMELLRLARKGNEEIQAAQRAVFEEEGK